MKIVRIKISNVRFIKTATIHPQVQNVLLGPNNSGKIVNPESMFRYGVITENDFHCRVYCAPQSPVPAPAATPTRGNEGEPQPVAPQTCETTPQTQTAAPAPTIRIEAVLGGLDQRDEDLFKDFLVPWKGGH
jgi:hypothetical protein